MEAWRGLVLVGLTAVCACGQAPPSAKQVEGLAPEMGDAAADAAAEAGASCAELAKETCPAGEPCGCCCRAPGEGARYASNDRTEALQSMQMECLGDATGEWAWAQTR